LLRIYLKSRLGPLRITEVTAEGEPGIQVDSELLAAAQIMPGEQVRLALGVGVPFVVFAAPSKRGSGTVKLTGFRVSEAERTVPLWLWTECLLVDREALAHEPRETRVDSQNHVVLAEG
jgi:aspartate 1-decarboxylase